MTARAVAGWLVAGAGTIFTAATVVTVALAFVLVTALCAGSVESERLRWALGVIVCAGLPLLFRWRLGKALDRRRLRRPRLVWWLGAGNALIVTTLALGFADVTGEAVRRHGDWFVGEGHGRVARTVRSTVARTGRWLETVDPVPELAPVVLPPDEPIVDAVSGAPPRPPPEPRLATWYHPLGGPRRALPGRASRRFGAARPQPRPGECQLGHCGVDLGSTVGEPVFAVFDGVVEKAQRDAFAEARAGRFLRIAHKDGRVVSRYLHLDTIAADLVEGASVKAGQLIGRLGRSGVLHSGAHLHFGLAIRENGRERYLDPEPFLHEWTLPALPAPPAIAQR